MSFQHQIPEQGAVPPSMPGEVQTASKLQTLRLRQLLDLAKAYAVEIPPHANTKTRILPYMIAAEESGVFRGRPTSHYHLLHAQLSHDTKPSDQLLADLHRAEWQEFPRPKLSEFNRLQLKAKEMGLKDTMGKSRAELEKMIREAENGPDEDAGPSD